MPKLEFDNLEHYVLNSLNEGLWISDADDCIVFFNSSMEKIAGISAVQAIGLNVTTDFSEETTSTFLKHFIKAKESLEATRYEADVTTPGGRQTIQAGALVPLVQNGRFEGMICTIIDITESKKIADALKESERRWRRAIQNSPVPIMIHDEDDTVLNLSSGWTTFSGYTIEDIPTLADWTERAYGERTGIKKDYIDQLFMIDETVDNGEWEVTAKDGSKRIWNFQTTPISLKNKGKRVLHSLAIDVTENKKAEVALRQKTQLLEASQSIAKVGGWELDLATDILFWTNETYRLHDTSPEEFNPTVEAGVGYFLPESRRIISEALELAITEGKGYDLVLQTFTTKGRLIDVRTTCEVTLVDGRPSKLTGIFQDITHRKKLEDLMQMSQRLESLGVLPGGIAHDFNNLLSGIFGNLELALEGIEDPDVSARLKKSIDNIDRARSLTNQLLTFAKGGEPNARTEELFPFVNETIKFALSGSSASCRFSIDDNLWSVDYDRNQLGQVIDNLAINALQAMPNGGLVEVSAANVELAANSFQLEPGDYVRLSIKDQGTGIPAHALPKIFEPYFSTKEKGHGLGLATSYSIIKRHGGAIDVNTTPDEGTTFHVYLPASNKSTPSASAAKGGRHRGHGTFLVMDDDQTVLELTKRMLMLFGYEVILTSEGNEAANVFASELAAGRRFAGVLLDLTVTGGTGGKDAVRAMRKVCPETPVFVASGYSDDPVLANPKQFGFNASITKPFTMKEFSNFLDTYLGTDQE